AGKAELDDIVRLRMCRAGGEGRCAKNERRSEDPGRCKPAFDHDRVLPCSGREQLSTDPSIIRLIGLLKRHAPAGCQLRCGVHEPVNFGSRFSSQAAVPSIESFERFDWIMHSVSKWSIASR